MNINSERSIEVMYEVFNYYACNRGVGHTNLMLNGAKNSECRIVACDSNHAKMIGKKAITLFSISRRGLRGLNLPLVFDNGTTVSLFNSLMNAFTKKSLRIMGLQEINHRLRLSIIKKNKKIDELKSELRKLKMKMGRVECEL